LPRPNPRYGDLTPTIPSVSTPTPPPQTKTPPPVIVNQGGAVNAQGGNRGTQQKDPEPTECYEVYGNKLQLTQAAVDYYKNINVDISKCGTAPPAKNGVTRQEFEELKQAVWKYDPKTGMTVGTGSQRSLTDVWNHLSRWVWGHGGEQWQAGGMAEKWDQPEPDALLPMTLRLHTEQESRLTDAHAHRQSIESKVEDLYSRKSETSHSHGSGNGTDWAVVVMGVLAIIVILIIVKYLFPLLKGLKGIIPSRGGNGNDSTYSRV